MIEQNYNLDTIPFSSAVPVVHVSQYDSGSRTLKFKLLAGGSNYDMTGVTGAQINGRKPDGTEFSYNMTISNDVVSIVITEQMAAVAGRVMAEVVLTGANSSVLGTANFIIEVEESPIDEGVISDTDVPIIMDFVTGGTPGQIFKRTATGGEWVNDTGGTASDVTYDNTDSGLTATNVQDAIDETVDELNAGLSSAVKSVNDITPDSNGNAEISASDVPANGMGERTTSGNPIEIEDGVAGNALDLSVELEPIQSGSGTPSPTNIRPITGRTEANVLRRGFNQWDEEWELGGFNGSTGQPDSFDDRIRSKNFCHCIPSQDYYGKAPVNCSLFIWWYDESNNFISFNNIGARIITSPANAHYFKISTYGGAYTTYNNDICINISDPAKNGTYEPYTGQTVTVSLGQTVYGGTLNVSTGELVVTHRYETITANMLTDVTVEANMMRCKLNTVIYDTGYPNAISNQFVVKNSYASVNANDHSMALNTIAGNQFLLHESSISQNLAGVQSLLTANPLTVCFEIATPLTFNLTPAQLSLLEGYNSITSNADTIHLKYFGSEASDVQAEIDEFENVTYALNNAITALSESVAPIETGTASQNYAVGDYLLLNGQFCKVTAAIATGETITVGTNVAETSVGDEITVIESQMAPVSGMNYVTRAVRKIGRLVQLNVVIDSTENTLQCQGWGSITIGMLPSEYRPSTMVNFPLLIATKTGAWINVMIRIGAGGHVAVADNIVGNTFIPRTIFLNVFWIQ